MFFGKSDAGSEAEMRNALRFAREKGMEKLQVYKEASLCGFRCVFPGDGKDKAGFKRFQDYLANLAPKMDGLFDRCNSHI